MSEPSVERAWDDGSSDKAQATDTVTDAGLASSEPAGETPVVKRASGRRTPKKTVGSATAEPAAAAVPSAAAADEDNEDNEASAAPAASTFSDGSAASIAKADADTSADAGADLSVDASDVPSAPARRSSRRRRSGPLADDFEPTDSAAEDEQAAAAPAPITAVAPLFRAPDPVAPEQLLPARSSSPSDLEQPGVDMPDLSGIDGDQQQPSGEEPADGESPEEGQDGAAQPSTRRRRSRGGRNRRKSSDSTSGGTAQSPPTQPADGDANPDASTEQEGTASAEAAAGTTSDSPEADGAGTTSSRRRRRRRSGDSSGEGDDATETTSRVREPKTASSGITSVEGSTRMEAKKQRRREGREAGRRRVPILSESEFLARRESVDRVMTIRQRKDVTQIAVLEDDVLVEHYVALEEQNSLLGNVYLGRVQNVLPSMEAAFVDIGKGRNAVLYAGEVNWDLVGDRHQARRIENALKPGQQIMVQVSKDPVGHKGARLTSQISLPGRYLVYVPGGGSSGISRKLPDTERSRLKTLLKDILPDESGVIVRTAAEGASEDELRRDVKRLTERWDEIVKLAKAGKSSTLLYAEPDVMLKVVRDLFTEDFTKLVITGDEAWDTVHDYVSYVAPDLVERLERYDADGDIFATYRVNEQIAKALERKVWLPSGGSLVIDRTEAMTVVDVNTGKFTGSGGNLESTVTKNNLEAAEEIVRQLRLRDIGGIIVIDFIDMVLENNRDLVLRRLVECLGRDRTRHQVAEVTSLGLVQMTRKRIGTGLVEAFSVPCETCHGRGVVIEAEPVTGLLEEQDHDNAGRGTASSKASSGRDRRSSKSRADSDGGGGDRERNRSEKATEQDSAEKAAADRLAADKHSAAAAATAAIAAALHPETKIAGVVIDSGVDVPAADVPSADVPSSDVPSSDVLSSDVPSDDVPTGDVARAEEAVVAATADKKPAKKATAKKSPAKESTAKKAAARKTTTRKRAIKRVASTDEAAAVDASAAEQTPETVGASS